MPSRAEARSAVAATRKRAAQVDREGFDRWSRRLFLLIGIAYFAAQAAGILPPTILERVRELH